MTFLENTAKKHLVVAALFAIGSVLVLTPVVSFAQERTATSTGSATSTGQSAQSDDQAYKFEPLTTLPGLSEISEAGDNPSAGLSGFFNTLYRLCIGAAAIIAVIQIMRAGFKIITNKGSFSQNEEAKSLIGNTVLGILLVLSPVIVFSIINPRILDLEFNFSDLSSARPNPADTTVGPQVSSEQCSSVYRDIRIVPIAQQSRYPGYSSIAGTCCSLQDSLTQMCIGLPINAPQPSPGSPAATQPPPTQPRAPVYGWREYFAPISAPIGTRGVVRGNISFSTAAACRENREGYRRLQASNEYATGEVLCSCDTPVTEQRSCPYP